MTVLQLVARQLAALVTADGDAAAADEAELRSRGPADGSTPQLLQSKALQELQQLQDKQQHQHGQLLPEVGVGVGSVAGPPDMRGLCVCTA